MPGHPHRRGPRRPARCAHGHGRCGAARHGRPGTYSGGVHHGHGAGHATPLPCGAPPTGGGAEEGVGLAAVVRGAAKAAVVAGLESAASIAASGRAMVLSDVGKGGLPPGAVGARRAAGGRQRGAPTAASATGVVARAGHGGLDPRGAIVPQADAGRWRAEDVGCGPHTRSIGSGTIVASASAPPPPKEMAKRARGETTSHSWCALRRQAQRLHELQKLELARFPLARQAVSSPLRGAGAVRSCTGIVHCATEGTSGH